MKISNKRLVVYATLMALGVVLMLRGLSLLMWLGLALSSLTRLFRSQKTNRRCLGLFLFYAATAVVILISNLRQGHAFIQETPPLWFCLAVGGAWAWGIRREFQKWRQSEVSHAA